MPIQVDRSKFHGALEMAELNVSRVLSAQNNESLKFGVISLDDEVKKLKDLLEAKIKDVRTAISKNIPTIADNLAAGVDAVCKIVDESKKDLVSKVNESFNEKVGEEVLAVIDKIVGRMRGYVTELIKKNTIDVDPKYVDMIVSRSKDLLPDEVSRLAVELQKKAEMLLRGGMNVDSTQFTAAIALMAEGLVKAGPELGNEAIYSEYRTFVLENGGKPLELAEFRGMRSVRGDSVIGFLKVLKESGVRKGSRVINGGRLMTVTSIDGRLRVHCGNNGGAISPRQLRLATEAEIKAFEKARHGESTRKKAAAKKEE